MLRKELLWEPGREDYLDGIRTSENLSEFKNKSTHPKKTSLITGDMKTMGCLPGHSASLRIHCSLPTGTTLTYSRYLTCVYIKRKKTLSL